MLETHRTGGGTSAISPAIVSAAVDAVTDIVVPSLLYALAVSPTSEPILYPEAWTRHSLQRPSTALFAAGRPWQEVAWQFPTDYGLGGGTRLIGAFLGVDLALADAQLVRIPSATLPVPGVIDDPLRRGVVERLVLEDAATSPLPAWTVADLAAGRRLVAAWRTGVDATALRDALRDAGIDSWRVNAMVWEVSRGSVTALESLNLTELSALGARTTGDGVRQPGWSGSSRLIDGCFCLARTRPVTPEQLRGRRLGVQALQPLDITLRLAEHLAGLGLEPSLVPALMPPALQDWLDWSHPAWSGDWEGYTLWPRTLPVERIEQYLLYLVSAGVFSPPAPTEVAQ
jgi:hypothetical protein